MTPHARLARATRSRCSSSRSRRRPSASSTSWSCTQPESNLEERRLSDLERVAGVYQAGARGACCVERGVSADARRAGCARVADATDSRVTLLGWKEDPEGRQRDKRGPRASTRVTDSREQRAVPAQRRARARGRSARGARRAASAASRARRSASSPSRCRPGDEPAVGGALLARLRGGRRDRLLHPRPRAAGHAARRCWSRCWAASSWRAALARRVRRLERAADEVARGRFIEPLPVDSEDELGQLTRTFNEMQAAAARRWTWRARSSSPPPRTSCARRSSRSPASWSCSRTRTSTRRPGASSSTRCASRWSGCRSCRSTCSTCRASTPARSSSQHRAGRPRRAGALGGRRVPARARRAPHRARGARCRRRARRPSCDRERVAQIMRILLDNALRHTPEGTDVTVSAQREQRGRRVHGGRRRARACRRSSRARRSSASTRATPRAAPGSGWRSPASWPSGWRAGSSSTTGADSTAFTLELPTNGARVVRRPSRSRARPLALVAAGCDACRRRRRPGAASTTREVTTTRVQVVEGIGRERRLRPAARSTSAWRPAS